MVNEYKYNISKDSAVLVKRESGRLARNKILLTIAVTSGIWLVLDIFLFYSSGFMSLQPDTSDDFKMPTDRRRDHKKKDFEWVNDKMKLSNQTVEVNKPRDMSSLLTKLERMNGKKEINMEQLARELNDAIGVMKSRIETFKNELNKTIQTKRKELNFYERVGLNIAIEIISI